MNGRRPTRTEKILLKARGLDPALWLIQAEYTDHYTIINRHEHNVMVLAKRSADDAS